MRKKRFACCRNCVNAFANDCYLLKRGLPCEFKPLNEEPDNRVGTAIAIAIIILFAAALFIWGCKPQETTQEPVRHVSAVKLLHQQHHELTEWEELQMAIIWTESSFRANAVGATSDFGLYQITPIYVSEVNRVAGTDYDHVDAFDPEKSVAMFAAMQDHYNPGRDLNLAIYYHNKSSEYKARVLKNLEMVRRYEDVRKLVKK